jgi:uncharacterized membrane protein YhaH (DUF805 family)
MFDFNGRSSRSEFWYFQLYVIFVFLLFVIIADNFKSTEIIGYFFAFFFILALLIPMVSTRFRRLHDTNKSGWYLLIGFIPIIGNLIMLIMYCEKSDENKNQYGIKPKA